MPFPFPDGTKNYLMELTRERKRGREREKESTALSRRRRSAIINSARSFLSIVIGVGRGRVSLDAFSLLFIVFTAYSPSYGLAVRESQPRTRTR